MKIRINLINSFGLACLASCVALHVPSHVVYSSGERSRSVERSASEIAARSYGDLPLSFEVNRGQTDSRVKFLSRGSGYNLYLTAKEAVMGIHTSARALPKNQQGTLTKASAHPSPVRMKLVGSNAQAEIVGLDELPGKSNYLMGVDPKKWRLNVPNCSRVKYKNAYPGVDVVFYGKGRELEYDFKVAPGASFKPIRISFDGARRVLMDASGDLVIQSAAGEFRQRKPVIYQETGGEVRAISGGYVIAGERDVAFEVGAYDQTRALVIDPVLVYSTAIGGLNNDNANAIAVDAAGNAYITGTTTSMDFPTANPFQANLRTGVDTSPPSDAFVTKLNAAGTAVLYSTYLGGGSPDGANSIAVDSSGDAYVTGFTASTDFPTTSGAFLTKSVTGGAAFITKLNPAGNSLVYSTYLGGPAQATFGANGANVGRGIALDAERNAYVTGYTFSESFPLKKPAQGVFNKGFSGCCDCLRFGLVPVREDAFVTKIDPSGTGLVYSSYLGGSYVDEGYGIAVDSIGSAYVTGATCSYDFPGAPSDGSTAAFLVKLSPSGRQFVYASSFGGRGSDFGNAVAVDSQGNAYVAGQTDSDDFPITLSALQPRLGGSVLYATTDGGGVWRPVSGFLNSSATALAIDPSNSLRMYGGLSFILRGNGLLVSNDGGSSWGNPGIGPGIGSPSTLAIDPKNPFVIYTEATKSTDRGMSWKAMHFPPFAAPAGPPRLLIDPVSTSTIYLLSLGGGTEAVYPPQFFKTTDGGSNWDLVRNGTTRFGPSSAVLDPKNPSTLYATDFNLYKSTDGGNTWRIPYEGNRNFMKLAIDPAGSTLYLTDSAGTVLRTTDGGATFSVLGRVSTPVNELLVDPANVSTLYAGTGVSGGSGGVFKSTDGGLTWNATLLARAVNVLVIDPANSSRLFAGVDYDVDSFVVKRNSAGSGSLYSTYLGSRSADIATSIAVDEAGNAYVTGKTFSDQFPATDALVATKPGGPFDTATFAAKLNVAGSAILFSTYLGGNGPSFGSGIAVDRTGRIYVAGTTGFPNFSPSADLSESARGGSDAFVAKIGSAPRITSASISGNNLIVNGEGFDQGAVISPRRRGATNQERPIKPGDLTDRQEVREEYRSGTEFYDSGAQLGRIDVSGIRFHEMIEGCGYPSKRMRWFVSR